MEKVSLGGGKQCIKHGHACVLQAILALILTLHDSCTYTAALHIALCPQQPAWYCSTLHLAPHLTCLYFQLFTLVHAGNDETDQTDKIFKMMGTPTEQTWPGISKLPQ